MTANVKFQVLSEDGISSKFIKYYMLCYDSNKNILSTNYYDNNTAIRGDDANLVVSDGCVIFCMFGDFSTNPPKFYTSTALSVSDITALPSDGMIGIQYMMTVDPTQPNTNYDLSVWIGYSYVRDPLEIINTLDMYTNRDITNQVSLLDPDTNKCPKPGNIIIGDAESISPDNPSANYNVICLPKVIPDAHFNNMTYGTTLTPEKRAQIQTTLLKDYNTYMTNNSDKSNKSDNSNSWMLWVVIILVIVIFTTVIIYLVRRHTKHLNQ